MAISFSRPDPSSPAAVSEAVFNTGRRGFDQQEVRDFLRMVAAELSRLQERERFLERELRDAQQRSPAEAMVDDDTVTQLLGEEATRILTAARDSATAIRTKAEEGAARLLRESSEEAQRQREEADLEAARRRSDALADAESERAMAKQQGREMVEEARAYRERVLSELSRRRELARQQLEHLVHGRDRLVQAFERARLVAVDVVAEMTPVDEPDEFVDLSPTTGPVPIMVPASRVGDESAIDESVLRMPASEPAADDAPSADRPTLVAFVDEPEVEEPPTILYDGGADDDVGLDEGEDLAATDDAMAVESEDDLDQPDDMGDDDAAADVADLFARLRANRPEDAVTEESATTDADDAPLEEELEETPFRQRDAVLVPLITAAGRKLKRVLADEQNEVLDRLRQRQAVVDLDGLVPAADEQGARYVDAIDAELIAAAEAGGAALGGPIAASGPGGVLAEVRAELAEQLVAPLRTRLANAVAEGEGDNDAVTKRVRPIYREWKTQRIDELLDDVFRTSHVAGAVASVSVGTPVAWIVDPDGPPSPDCEDNALAGAVALGTPFPSGHQWPPMDPGCRCLLVLTEG